MQIIFEDTIKMAIFVSPDGIISYSQIMRDEVNEYDYVADGNGETWLLDEVNILRVDEYTQTEILELEDLEDFEQADGNGISKALKGRRKVDLRA